MNLSQFSHHKPSRQLVFLIHFGFILVGIGTVQIGVILPALARQLALDDAQSANLLSMQFAGALAGTFLTSFLWRRIGFLPGLIAGLLAMGFGIFGLGFPFSWETAAFCIFLNGAGQGVVIPTTNLLVATLYGEKSASALNIVNFSWGIGALICPVFFGLLASQTDLRLPLVILSALFLTVALLFAAFVRAAKNVHRSKQTDISENSENKSAARVWGTSFVLLTAALLFLYVGIENSLGYWLTSFALRVESNENTLFAAATSVFWAMFLTGRLCAPLGLRYLSENRFILFCVICAAFGAAIIIFSPNQTLLAVGAAAAGLGFAPIFPTVFAQFTRRLGGAAAAQAKWLFLSNTAGGAVITWLVGVISDATGDLRRGLLATLVCCGLMILLQTIRLRDGTKS